MLIHWKDRTLDVQTYDEEFLWHSEVIDVEMLFKENSDLWLKIRKGSDKNLESAINIALKNTYIDIRFLTVCSILANIDDVPRVKPYIDALLEEKRIHSTGTIDTQVKSINQASQLLGVYIRHKKFQSGGIESYSGWQAKLLENFNRKFSQKMVSGRMYLGWHNVSIDDEFIQLIVPYSSSKWKLSKSWLEILKSNIYSFANREEMIRIFRVLIDIAQKKSEYKLLSPDITSEETSNYRKNFVESMEGLIDEIEQINNSHIINSDIDKTILSEMAKVASNDFIAGKTKFPLNMFNAIKKDRVGLIINNQVITRGFEKSYIMSEDRPEIYNLVESYGEVIADYLKDIVLRKVVLTDLTDDKCFDSLENMLFYILNYTKTSDNILLCHPSLCTLILDLYKDEQKRENFQITKSYSEDYFCKIGDCKVYNHSFDIVNSCILTTKDKFKTLTIEDFEDGNIFNVSFNENEKDKTKGDLSFDYKLDIETDKILLFIKLNLVLEDIKIDEEAIEEHITDVIQEELEESKVLSKLNTVFSFFSKHRR